MVRRAHASGDIYLGTYEGWYCPNEGFRTATEVVETARGTICPNHPEVPLQWLTERNWFFRLSAYQERLERHFAEHPDFVQPEYRRNEMLGFIRGGLEDFSISRERTPGDWGIPFPIAENGETALREDGSWDPEAGKIYVWFDALINYITGRRLPRRPRGVRPLVAGRPAHHRQGHRPVPHDLLAGHAVERRARGAAPRLGPRLAAGGRRRADEQEPRQLLRPGRLRGRAGRRRRALRGPARGALRSRRGGVVGLVRAALQRRPRQRLREPRQPHRVDDQPLSRGRAAGAARGRRLAAGRASGRRPGPRTASGSTASSCTRRWPSCGRSSGRPTRRSTPSSRGSWPRPPRPATRAAEARLRDVLGDLIEACRLVGLAAAPFLPATAPRLLAQLGHAYPYGPDGNGGPPILDELGWGVHADRDRPGLGSGAALPAARRRERGSLILVRGSRRFAAAASADPLKRPDLRCRGASRRQPLPPQR